MNEVLDDLHTNIYKHLCEILSACRNPQEIDDNIVLFKNMLNLWSNKLTNNNSEMPLTIGVYGTPKQGKSTLLNSILGEEILPNSPIPTTGSIIDIVYSKDLDHYIVRGFKETKQYIKNFSSVSETKAYLIRVGTQDKPYDSIEVSGKFPNALDIFKNHGVRLRDTPGAEEEAASFNLKRDSPKTKMSLESTYLPIFCINATTVGQQSDVAFYQKNFKNILNLHVLTYAEDLSSQEKNEIKVQFLNTFELTPDKINPQKIIFTGKKDIESSLLDKDDISTLDQELTNIMSIEYVKDKINFIAREFINNINFYPWAPKIHIQSLRSILKN